MRLLKLLTLSIIVLSSAQISFAQGGYEDLLFEEVEVVNPVYMPVASVGIGVINYYGELHSDLRNILQGQPSYRMNLYNFIDNKHYWKFNVNTIFGNMSGYERSYKDTSKNLNFESKFFSIGGNVEYAFGDLFKGEKKIRPFVSVGGEYITITGSNTDIKDENGRFYKYFPDGTIRVGDELITRDYDYETNIRELNRFGQESFKTSTFAIVADAGLDFKISNRVTLRLATSLHYTFSDDFDGVSNEHSTDVTENPSLRMGDAATDMFSLTYLSMNIDLFSSPKTITQELLFADVEYDAIAYMDDDRDRILDLADNCPDTPKGVEVDSVGCPHDDDGDGVPNYKDKEQFSNKGAIVDEFGAELSANKIRDGLFQDLTAVRREDVYMMPIGMGWSKYSEMTDVEIPEKFTKLDKDGDNYISFDELLDAINGFFDFDSEFSSDDIYELNNFFFAQ